MTSGSGEARGYREDLGRKQTALAFALAPRAQGVLGPPVSRSRHCRDRRAGQELMLELEHRTVKYGSLGNPRPAAG